ncbi:metallopeptidase [Colletotrichum scovillei]|nr:metallopeptidase [Colletotrichum scovillei]KAH8421587.1 metallopeptidase [Colletotrichum scovillei]KAH8421740.1 metallopeptidase [Colletotrichum scovillei]
MDQTPHHDASDASSLHVQNDRRYLPLRAFYDSADLTSNELGSSLTTAASERDGSIHTSSSTAVEAAAATSSDDEGHHSSIEQRPLYSNRSTMTQNSHMWQPEKNEQGTDESSQQATDTNQTIWQIWRLEILSSLLALGCVLAIIIILALHQSKPLPKWLGVMSVNTLIATFNAVYKASLIMPVAEGLGQLKWDWFQHPQKLADVVAFDDATRGPWGSLLLITKKITQEQRPYLAGLGALITIAAIAIDPVSQAMVEHKGCSRAADSVNGIIAEIPRVNHYTAGPMDSDIVKGLADPQDLASMINFKCATGNCTFENEENGSPFSSLAICHSCQDITDRVIKVQEGPDAPFYAWQLSYDYNYTVPSLIPEVSSPWNSSKLSLLTTPGIFDKDKVSFRPFYSFDVLTIVDAPCNHLDDTCADEVNSSAFAVRCRLDACVKHYHGKVQDGVYSEIEHPKSNEILTWTDEWTLVANSSLINGKEMSCTARERWAPQTVRVESVDGGPFQLSPTSHLSEREGDKAFGRRKNVIWKFVPPECVWRIDASSWRAIISTLQDILQNNVTHSMLDGRPGIVTGPTWLKQVYAQAAGNLSTVENLARGLANSMTAGMRNKPYDGLDDKRIEELYSGLRAVVGATLVADTCVYVHWPWIVYPVALLMLQWTFCVLVLANRRSSPSNGRQQYRAWKSSPLALLFNGLDEDLSKRHGGLYTLKGMKQVADSTTVQMVPADGCKDKALRFCEIKA